MTTSTAQVTTIVETTRAIRWWTDEQTREQKTDDGIQSTLPVAVEFISGRLTLGQLAAVDAYRSRNN